MWEALPSLESLDGKDRNGKLVRNAAPRPTTAAPLGRPASARPTTARPTTAMRASAAAAAAALADAERHSSELTMGSSVAFVGNPLRALLARRSAQVLTVDTSQPDSDPDDGEEGGGGDSTSLSLPSPSPPIAPQPPTYDRPRTTSSTGRRPRMMLRASSTGLASAADEGGAQPTGDAMGAGTPRRPHSGPVFSPTPPPPRR